jgi:hypothetical protein
MSEEEKINKTKVYQHGYVAGYNQCCVDRKEITQKDADRILRKTLE